MRTINSVSPKNINNLQQKMMNWGNSNSLKSVEWCVYEGRQTVYFEFDSIILQVFVINSF